MADDTTQRTTDEHLDEQAVPVDLVDDVAGDDEVAALEQRITGGDEQVTAEQLTAARERAAGRLRFGRLRQVAADRKARRDTEQAEHARVARAQQAAREQLADVDDAVVAARFDAAVAAVEALREIAEQRGDLVARLARTRGELELPDVHRDRDAWACSLTLDGRRWHASDADAVALVGRALRLAGLYVRGGGTLAVSTRLTEHDRKLPAVVERGRAAVQDGRSRSRRRNAG